MTDIQLIPAGELEQGSLAWHELRQKHYPASEAGAVMSVNPWSPKNPRELAAYRKGEKIVEDNYAMSRGRQHEDEARAELARATGVGFAPCVAVRGKYMASLDGYALTNQGNVIVAEIKVPMKIDKLRDAIAAGLPEIPPNYFWQLVQQAWCSNCDQLLFSAHEFRGGQQIDYHTLWIEGESLREHWPILEAAWEDFERTNHEPMEVTRHDDEWREAARAYSLAKAALAEARKHANIPSFEKAEKDAKERLKALADEVAVSTTGFGVVVTRTEKESYFMKPGVQTRISGSFEE